jgi:poly(3-hydroxybutyrate) depolymerase
MDAKTQQTMQVGGTTRYYLAYVPTTYDPNTPMPMIFALHGMNMNNWWAANDGSGFKLIEATANKAILVYPQGTGDAPGTKSQWGGINSNWSPGTTGADDKFIDALLTSMEDSYCVDTSRVFVTGFSMGGWMTSNFACDHNKVFRAFAPVAGWGPGDMQTGHGSKPSCSDTSTVPIIITQGTTDGTVTPENGTNSRDFWITRDGCSAITAANSTGSTANCVAAAGCKSGAVSWCTHGGGHMVPSNAGTYIWSFFSQF